MTPPRRALTSAPETTSERSMRPMARRLAAVATLGLVGVAVPALNADAATKNYTIFAAEDTYSSKPEANLGHGSRGYVYATHTGASNGTWENVGYLKFDTSNIPTNASIHSVKLRVFVQTNQKPGGSPIVWTEGTDWSEGSLTWDNRRPSTTSILNPAVNAPAGEWVTIELNPFQSVKAGGTTALEVGYTIPNSNFRFDSREAGNAPQLLVETATGAAAQQPVAIVAPVAAPTTQAPAPAPTTAAPAPVQAAPAQTAPAENTSVPSPAAGVGFSKLVFNDDFNDLSSIDLTGNGVAGKKWFTDRPFGFGKMPNSDLSVNNGVLTINQSHDNLNYGISTYSKKARTGTAYQYGYFEARIRFDQSNAAAVRGFPSFWGVSRDYMLGDISGRYGEFDVMEAWHPPYAAYNEPIVAGTIHDWFDGSDHMTVGNNVFYANGYDMLAWHTYGALWEPGKVTWYMDGKVTLVQKYSAGAAPSPNYLGHPTGTYSILDRETNGQVMVLGSGPGIPMEVDYVRIYK